MGFTEEVLNEWKTGMLKGVKKNDWTALITAWYLHFGLSEIVCSHLSDSKTAKSESTECGPGRSD
jgi:hypothetical protein